MRNDVFYSFLARLAAIFFALLGLLSISLESMALQYGSGIENTDWKISGSIFECRFEQTLPEYGTAVFYHEAGEDIVF